MKISGRRTVMIIFLFTAILLPLSWISVLASDADEIEIRKKFKLFQRLDFDRQNVDSAEDNERKPREPYAGLGRDTGGAVRLERAGEMRQETQGEGTLTFFERDVKFVQDSMSIWCDAARYFQIQGKLILTGKVLMIDPQRQLAANRVTYNELTKKTIAQGHVHILRDSVELYSRQGHYTEEFEVASFYGDLEIYDHQRDILMTGGRGEWQNIKQRGEVPEIPVLTQFDSTGNVDVQIISKFMSYTAADDGIADAREEVEIEWGDVKGTCNRLLFYSNERKALMLGDPVVWQERNEARGDSIWLYLTEEKLDSVEVFGNAKAFMTADSTEDALRSWMKAFRIVMDFDSSEVKRIEGDTQAVSVYHIFEDGEDQGSNKVSGDNITLFVKDGTVSSVVVEGGTEGTYYPSELAKEVRRDE